MRRLLATTAVLACTLTLAAGCGDDEKSSDGSSQETKTIKVTFESGSVTPVGERISVGVGQPIVLDVTADEAGEIHVHSSPDQELEYKAGETELPLTIKQAGIIEVESHTLDKVILQLEVK